MVYYSEEYFNNQPPTKSTMFLWVTYQYFQYQEYSVGYWCQWKNSERLHPYKTLGLRFLCTEIYIGAGFILGKINAKLKKKYFVPSRCTTGTVVLQKCVALAF
jgi:hypothetical protein